MKRGWFPLIGVASLLGVIGYNYWAYCCGRCSMSTFFTLGPFGLTLMGGVFVMGLILLVLKIRHQGSNLRCRCGFAQEEGWSYCPACGTERLL